MLKKIKNTTIKLLGGSADRIYPTSYQAVDIVIINAENNTILLGQKWQNKTRTEPKSELRFCGGFVDPSDFSLEYAAKRECREEAGQNLGITEPNYVGSLRIDDPRYRNSEDKIMSAVFVSYYMFGTAKGGDDIAKVGWYQINWLKDYYKLLGILAPEHIPIVDLLIKKRII